ncbi:uncharacterized protein PgNI_07488 [Pyricularia grisea]|uniref:Uncharacterized protein n=1 Tax=Pyricularia grisea TaxID=148305 RepID=A0A6P8B0S1_PYRGI|nr:uncharacterized protein PgNI_07488 [Pyricularia grisea]TLD08313.1 hypothetical protein PgNI_07488 [Pyricularia grisea]
MREKKPLSRPERNHHDTAYKAAPAAATPKTVHIAWANWPAAAPLTGVVVAAVEEPLDASLRVGAGVIWSAFAESVFVDVPVCVAAVGLDSDPVFAVLDRLSSVVLVAPLVLVCDEASVEVECILSLKQASVALVLTQVSVPL